MSALPAQSPCRHCGAAVEADAPKGAVYCCSGCELAAAIVDGAGLEAYYAGRSKPAPRPEGPARGLDQFPVETDAAGLCHATLRLDGLRCASCVWLTERVIEGRPGVKAVMVMAPATTRADKPAAMSRRRRVESGACAVRRREAFLELSMLFDSFLRWAAAGVAIGAVGAGALAASSSNFRRWSGFSSG
jgi:Cu2+-exporting ATPase